MCKTITILSKDKTWRWIYSCQYKAILNARPVKATEGLIMITSKQVKQWAKAAGADLVGIAPMDRFEGAPKQMDPRYIYPEAKSMIVMAFRILRGTLRGIEEGTFFQQYSSMGYAAINKVQQPMVLWNLCRLLENHGYEAIPIPNQSGWASIVTGGYDSDNVESARSTWSKPVTPDRPAPDVFIHMRIAAYLAGLGEIGYSKVFLTPEFGPRQRLAAVMTDADLEPDPIFEGKICDRCKACARDCTGGAISMDKTVKVILAGHEVEWAEINVTRCSEAFSGSDKSYNPFMVTKEDEIGFTSGGIEKTHQYKVPALYDHGRALEGARGCIRACMVHLEEKGVLRNKFKNKFRIRPPWKLADETATAEDAAD